MEKENTFVDMLREGLCSVEDIDDYIEKWHNEYNGNLELYEYLGMTEDEYDSWLTNPKSLKTMFNHTNKKKEYVYAKKLIKIAKELME